MGPRIIEAADLRLGEFIRPGDTVVCGQTAAEPLTLTQALVEQRADLSGARVFLGAVFSRTFAPEHADHLRFSSYGVLGAAAALGRQGLIDVLPCSYHELECRYASGALAADVVLLQLAPGGGDGPYSLGMANDYVAAAARRARVVIAEVHPDVPWTHGAAWPRDARIDVVVPATRPPLDMAAAACGPVEEAIGRHVAALIPDGAVLQTGIGAIPDAVLAALRSHRDLGLHSGMAGDRMVELIEAGVVTNARKPFDAGIGVVNVLAGTASTRRHAHRNPALIVRPARYTHAQAVLSTLHALHAINSALQVDLGGQVNSEMLGGVPMGGIGGLNDFVRGARAAPGGRSIIALPSTARSGAVSRIVARLDDAVVTVPRCDADLVVTEWGVADLRACTLAERARRLTAVAAPQFRESLEKAWRGARQ
ncbi:MAG TPA: acetyl-CoA hydrolase/transferase C-terminal domain-containing protein [Bordetella sp.]